MEDFYPSHTIAFLKIILIFLIAFPITIPAQSFQQDSTKGYNYYKKADKNWKDIDTCYKYSLLALPLLKKTKQWNPYVYTLCGLNSIYSAKEQYDSMLINNNFAFEEAKKYLLPNNTNYIFALNNLALAESDVKENDLKALELFRKAYNLLDSSNIDYAAKAPIEENIGQMHFRLGDLETALKYYTQSIESWKKVNTIMKRKTPHIRIARVYIKIADLFYEFKQYKIANSYALKIFENLEKAENFNQSYHVRGLIIFSKIKIALTEYNYALNALIELEELPNLTPLQKQHLFYNKGLAFFKIKKKNDAIKNLNYALKQKLPKTKTRHRAKTLRTLGEVYHSQEQYFISLKKNQEGIKLLMKREVLKNDLDAPNSTSDVFSKLELFKILINKGKTLTQIYQNTNDQKYLIAALNNYTYLSQLTDDIRSFYQSDESQLLLLDEAKDFYEAAIHTSFLLYEKNKNLTYLKDAFFFSEKSKSELLLDELRKKEFSGKGIIADSLLKKQYELRIAINFNQKILNKEHLKNQKKRKKLENILFDLKKELAYLNEQINLEYPTYFTLTKQLPISINMLQNQLDSSQILLEYFVGNENIFLFKISKDSLDLIKLADDFHLDDALFNFLTTDIKIDGNLGVSDFSAASYNLYKFLLPKNQLTLDKKNIIIIPDGQLENLSFDILLTASDSSSSLKKLPYFIKQFTTSYAYSATIFAHQMSQKPYPEVSTIGIFPSFKNPSQNLQNQDEIRQFLKRFYGTFLNDTEATKKNLSHHIIDHQIIHFSTHARGKDSIQHEPSIDLSDGSILLSDLQTFNLSASLAVLRACETNEGTYRKGEGIMSLSRGFTFAGVPSVIASTSFIDELSTSKIILSFYKNLEQNKSKPEALRQAKLDYLNSAIPESLRTPYHWGTFLAIGNTDPITFKYASQKSNWWYFLSIPVLLLFFLFFKKTKSN